MQEHNMPEDGRPLQDGRELGDLLARSAGTSPKKVQNAFQKLYDSGFRYIVPIAPPGSPISPKSILTKKAKQIGKIPGVRHSDGLWTSLKDWQRSKPDELTLQRWSGMGAGVGIRTGLQHDGTYLYAFDADTKVQDCADTIRKQLKTIFGDLPTRIGDAPKALYLVRCSGPIPYTQFGFDGGVLELLGEGKQFVSVAIHPGTMKPYFWTTVLRPLDELPVQDPEAIIGAMNTLRGMLPEAGHLYQEGGGGDRRKTPQRQLVGDPDMVERALRLIPNVYAPPGRQNFVKMAAAARAAFQDDYERGRDAFVEWAEKAEVPEPEDDPADTYKSMKAPFSVGAPWLYELAEAADKTGEFKKAAAIAVGFYEEDAGAAVAFAAEARATAGQTTAARDDVFELLSLGQIINQAPPCYLIDRYVPEASFGFLVGAPSSGKSFIALDWALTIAFGKQTWHGDVITADPDAYILYLAGEGQHGFRARVLAWAKHHGIPEAEIDGGRFRMIPVTVEMMVPEQIDKLIRTLKLIPGRPCLVIVDTVSRAMPGANENLQQDMTLFVKSCDRIKHGFGCTVLGVHHLNKDGDVRGSTVLEGAGDFMFMLSRVNATSARELYCRKMKDGPDDWSEKYEFDVVMIEGGSSLVPARRVIDSAPVAANIAADQEAQVLAALDAAWKAGNPWGETRQAKDRHAVLRMRRLFKIPADVAEAMLKRLREAGVIAIKTRNSSTKLRGYCLLEHPAFAAAPGVTPAATAPGTALAATSASPAVTPSEGVFG